MRTLFLISICRASLLCNTIFFYECLEWCIIYMVYWDVAPLTNIHIPTCESRLVFCLGRIRNFQIPCHNHCYLTSGVWRSLWQWFALLITAQYKSFASPCEISKYFFGVWTLNCKTTDWWLCLHLFCLFNLILCPCDIYWHHSIMLPLVYDAYYCCSCPAD